MDGYGRVKDGIDKAGGLEGLELPSGYKIKQKRPKIVDMSFQTTSSTMGEDNENNGNNEENPLQAASVNAIDASIDNEAALIQFAANNLLFQEMLGIFFLERLMMAEACHPNEIGGYVVEKILTSTFQADALIAHRFKRKKSDLIYGNDSDYFVLL